MILLAGMLLLPLLAALLLPWVPRHRPAIRLNALVGVGVLALALPLALDPPESGLLFYLDDLNLWLIVLTALVSAASAVYSIPYLENEWAAGRFTRRRIRLFNGVHPLLTFALLLALTADNLALFWVGLEIAAVGVMLMTALYSTPEALAAAWKFFLLASVGLALALFGIILLYLAAQPALGEGLEALAWSRLMGAAEGMSPDLLNLAFVFMLVGFGTMAGLFPLHAWLPDVQNEGPTPISAVFSGLLITVSLYMLLRLKSLMAAHPEALPPGPVLMGFGVITALFAAFMLHPRRRVRRLLAYASLQQVGVVAFAFGLGGPLIHFAGLLHLTLLSLITPALFFVAGFAIQLRGAPEMERLAGLTVSHPTLGWLLVAGAAALVGLPPFGLFTSQFILLTDGFARAPALTLALALSLLIGFGGLLGHVQRMAFGTPPTDEPVPRCRGTAPIQLLLGLALLLGIHLPEFFGEWLQRIALSLG
ncbi:MAG: hydrogenase 4 subunit F [Magnetococcales bacterium]|nr:hydrogenase 4 subunit F [Magnetococcales bacterium]